MQVSMRVGRLKHKRPGKVRGWFGGRVESQAVRGLDAIGNVQKRHETGCEIKAAMNCRNPKYSKAARGRAAIQIYQSGERLAALQ